MCGIFCLFDLPAGQSGAAREVALQQARLLRHRGPDWSGVWAGERAVMAHERLSIVDVLHGAQPLRSADGNLVLAVNGEIYNHLELRRELGPHATFQTDSDCEVILPLYASDGPAPGAAPAWHVRLRAPRRRRAATGSSRAIRWASSRSTWAGAPTARWPWPPR
jgi:asparagine synthetase B (glutamine-hydrolysing)